MAEDSTTQASTDPAEPQATPDANPGAGDPFARLDSLFESRDDAPAPSTVQVEADEPTASEPPADSGDEPSTPGEGDPQPSRREAARARDERLVQLEQVEQRATAAEQRATEIQREYQSYRSQVDQSVRQGLDDIGKPGEEAQLQQVMLDAEPYSDEWATARDRLIVIRDETKRFSIAAPMAHRAVMSSTINGLREIAAEAGLDPAGINPDDPNVTVEQHFVYASRALRDAAVAHVRKAEIEPLKAQLAEAQEQLETDRVKLAGYGAFDPPNGGQSGRTGGGRTTFDPNRSPQENLDAAATAFAGGIRR